MKRLLARRGAALSAGLLAASVLAGSVVAAQLSAPPDAEELGAAIEEARMMRVADIPATASARARGVFVQVTSTGHLCLWDAPSATSRERGGGCDPLTDPLGGSEISASLAYEGGPGVEAVRDARLIGLASAEVREVYALMSDGSERHVVLRNVRVAGAEYRAFGYRIKPSDLRKSIGPTAVVAVNDAGEEIGRQATGFAG